MKNWGNAARGSLGKRNCSSLSRENRNLDSFLSGSVFSSRFHWFCPVHLQLLLLSYSPLNKFSGINYHEILMKCFLLWLHQCCGGFPLHIHSPLPHVPCSCLVDSDANLSRTQTVSSTLHACLYRAVCNSVSFLAFKCYCHKFNS